ncbi:DNA (cytosine-5-)-methyltransferase [Mycoplasmopsis felis]|uniref:DNA (cytosine-5-)-methyltransferase n=1 Tax=Mycoplasmopsis felis TaxID=33923 RepID=UPI002AFECD40|nr:DNA (cytosine-5-)-methyltransferase [Mycoplasmopsis felis]WQQ04201.1 DNA (cytosine-5-)-methyltransferase [Mycoplasmopsis felis]
MLPSNIDIFTYSFPCQDISQQGKQKGINEQTRSGLLLQVKRILEINKDNLPTVLLLENVKALGSKKFTTSLNEWILFLESLGYVSEYKILNSSDFGSCQNRERLFMVSILKNKQLRKFNWPIPFSHNKRLENIIKLNEDDIFLDKLKDKQITEFKVTKNNITKSLILEYTKFNSENYLYKPFGFGPTLTASGANSRIKFYFGSVDKVKEITPLESYLYMGFSKKDANKVINSGLINKSKMIFTCGNSISVEVLESLFESIIKCIK